MKSFSVLTVLFLSVFMLSGCGGGGGGAPVADAGPDQSVTTGATVTLDGSGSTDADGDSLTYSWSLTSVPTGTALLFQTLPWSLPPLLRMWSAFMWRSLLLMTEQWTALPTR